MGERYHSLQLRVHSPRPRHRMTVGGAYEQVRTNPKSYPGVQGPGYKNVDLNLAKFFKLTEKIRLEFKMEAYNLANTFSGADPITDIRSSSFGRVTRMAPGTQGRELQYNGPIHWRSARGSYPQRQK